jgi:hypothetical protein
VIQVHFRRKNLYFYFSLADFADLADSLFKIQNLPNLQNLREQKSLRLSAFVAKPL